MTLTAGPSDTRKLNDRDFGPWWLPDWLASSSLSAAKTYISFCTVCVYVLHSDLTTAAWSLSFWAALCGREVRPFLSEKIQHNVVVVSDDNQLISQMEPFVQVCLR